MENFVSVWQETILLPTYNIGEAEKNPIFLEKRVYQGSSGAVYPHPVVEKIEDDAPCQGLHRLGRRAVVLEQKLGAIDYAEDLRVGQGVDGKKVHERVA